MLADTTGTITVGCIEAALSSEHPCTRSLGKFGRTVTLRYRALLAELDAESGEAHGQFIAAMISGDLISLEARNLGTGNRSGSRRFWFPYS